MTAPTPKQRTVKAIVDKDGKAYQASATSNVWPGGDKRFAEPTYNNKVRAFTNGKDYFADLIQACLAAQSEICIAGWQVNWDALLAPGVTLYDLLHDIVKANAGVIINVMPWAHSVPLETYDGQTATVLRQLNAEFKTKQIRIVQSPSYASVNQRYFSHHQKQVVIDRKIAYLGGMDLAYGRYDDDAYSLYASQDGREAMNRYNGCVAQVGKVDASVLVNPDLMTGALDNFSVPYVTKSTASGEVAKLRKRGHWQPKYGPAGPIDTWDNASASAGDTVDPTTLDPDTQPRMPWQDVHCRIEGPAVSDLLRNFVLRWNIQASTKERLPMPEAPKTYADAGQTHIQVLRSAPSAHCVKEQRAVVPKPTQPSPTATQDDIHQTMLLLIEKSRRFIYIENQFFVSAFGHEAPRGGDLSSAANFISNYDVGTFSPSQKNSARIAGKASDTPAHDLLNPPTNGICRALIARITRNIKHKNNPPMHVYITLPVHPEGTLSNASTVVQVYWTMQTLVFGTHSLLNGIRRALKAREVAIKEAPAFGPAFDAAFDRAFADEKSDYDSIPIEKCSEYVTLLNLRNWGKVGDRYITEQVYVHSKVMIVDDLYAVLGSANINDRSLLGERDSELAVLVVDGQTKHADVNGVGSHKEVRAFAHELRMSLWKKLFGISGGVRPATELATAIEQPGKPESWRLIQKRAAKNAELYEAAFAWVPRNTFVTPKKVPVDASILPTWDSSEEPAHLSSPMPFQPEFWDRPQHAKACTQLDQVKGFITALPIYWTKGENNRFEYPTPLVTDNMLPVSAEPNETKLSRSESSTPKPAEATG
jgi:phospholipase D1/2